MYEKLKGMKEVLHQREKELSTQWAAIENACENHHKDQKLLVEKKIMEGVTSGIRQGHYFCKLIRKPWPLKTKTKQCCMMNS
jgi:predicted nucleic acid-binding OB-fold protein